VDDLSKVDTSNRVQVSCSAWKQLLGQPLFPAICRQHAIRQDRHVSVMRHQIRSVLLINCVRSWL
jgi:hypothetical protein